MATPDQTTPLQVGPTDSITAALADYVSFDAAANSSRQSPRLVLLVGPCRSGTTALCRAIAYSDVTVVYQKIKESLRTVLVEKLADSLTDEVKAYFHVDAKPEESLRLPKPGPASNNTLFLKETFGGAHPLESFFDPLSVLLQAGVPPQNIVLVTILREPLSCFASWVKNWGHAASVPTLAENFALAMKATAHAEQMAVDAGVQHVKFDYDALGVGWCSPRDVVASLAKACALNRTDVQILTAVTGWTQQGDFLRDTVRLNMPLGEEHVAYLAKVHKDLCASDGLRYTPPPHRDDLLAKIGNADAGLAVLNSNAVQYYVHSAHHRSALTRALLEGKEEEIVELNKVKRIMAADFLPSPPVTNYGNIKNNIPTLGNLMMMDGIEVSTEVSTAVAVPARKGHDGVRPHLEPTKVVPPAKSAQLSPFRTWCVRAVIVGGAVSCMVSAKAFYYAEEDTDTSTTPDMLLALALISHLALKMMASTVLSVLLVIDFKVLVFAHCVSEYIQFTAKQNEEFRKKHLYPLRDDIPRLLWGLLTCWSRRLPSIQVLGAAKAGTTSIYATLLAHPDVAAGVTKESHFFDGRSIFGAGEFKTMNHFLYASFFPTVFTHALHYVMRGGHELKIVDATPVNLYLPWASRWMQTLTPAANIIIILRDPVERAWSHFKMNRDLGRIPVGQTFYETLLIEEKREAMRKSIAEYNNLEELDDDSVYSHLRRGQYAEQIARFTARFPFHQVLLVAFEDLKNDPVGVASCMYKFCGLAEVHVKDGDTRVMNRGTGVGNMMPIKARLKLQEAFMESNKRLTAVYGFDRGDAWNKLYSKKARMHSKPNKPGMKRRKKKKEHHVVIPMQS